MQRFTLITWHFISLQIQNFRKEIKHRRLWIPKVPLTNIPTDSHSETGSASSPSSTKSRSWCNPVGLRTVVLRDLKEKNINLSAWFFLITNVMLKQSCSISPTLSNLSRNDHFWMEVRRTLKINRMLKGEACAKAETEWAPRTRQRHAARTATRNAHISWLSNETDFEIFSLLLCYLLSI